MKKEIEISLHDKTLTISGERKREESSEQGFLFASQPCKELGGGTQSDTGDGAQ
jgi:HSP20 family molecular chaperone IbpA